MFNFGTPATLTISSRVPRKDARERCIRTKRCMLSNPFGEMNLGYLYFKYNIPLSSNKLIIQSFNCATVAATMSATLSTSSIKTKDEINWYFEEQGTGPHLVLVPSGEGDCYSFRKIAAILSKTFHVITFDMPGSEHPLFQTLHFLGTIMSFI